MTFMEWTKIVTAVTAAVLMVPISNFLANDLYRVEYLPKSVYAIEGVQEQPVNLASLHRSWPQALGTRQERIRLLSFREDMPELPPGEAGVPAGPAAPAAPEPPLDLATRMAQADLMRGERSSRKCAACHTFDAGGRNGVGPNLHGIVGKDIAAAGGFSYSPAMVGKAGSWTPEELDEFLLRPAEDVPGTRMTFVGLPNQQERADLITYLQTLR
jgi:cytochrome c